MDRGRWSEADGQRPAVYSGYNGYNGQRMVMDRCRRTESGNGYVQGIGKVPCGQFTVDTSERLLGDFCT